MWRNTDIGIHIPIALMVIVTARHITIVTNQDMEVIEEHQVYMIRLL